MEHLVIRKNPVIPPRYGLCKIWYLTVFEFLEDLKARTGSSQNVADLLPPGSEVMTSSPFEPGSSLPIWLKSLESLREAEMEARIFMVKVLRLFRRDVNAGHEMFMRIGHEAVRLRHAHPDCEGYALWHVLSSSTPAPGTVRHVDFSGPDSILGFVRSLEKDFPQ